MNAKAPSNTLAPLSGQIDLEAFSATFKGKGWKQKDLAERWGVTDRYIRKIKANTGDAKPYYIDAVFGIYILEKGGNAHEDNFMTSKEFRDTYKAKGWTEELLAERWGYADSSGLRVMQTNLPPHLVDAVRGLPDIQED